MGHSEARRRFAWGSAGEDHGARQQGGTLGKVASACSQLATPLSDLNSSRLEWPMAR